MKKKTFFLVFLVFGYIFSSCSTSKSLVSPDDEIHTFKATIIEISDNYILVVPLDGEDILRSSDRISFGRANLSALIISIGDVVSIQYKGDILETYPAKVNAVNWYKIE
jgi:hypothetical protein